MHRRDFIVPALAAVSPLNGRRPVTISQSTAPSAPASCAFGMLSPQR
ncbi:MAG: hypothetical protein U0Q12_27615 [Vicinamibacterales bacterium]